MWADALFFLGLWFAGWAACALVQAALRRAARRRSPASEPAEVRREAHAPPQNPTPAWQAELMVDLVDETGRLLPAVQIEGYDLPPRGQLRLEIVDPQDRAYWAGCRTITPDHVGRHLRFPALLPPGEVSAREAVGWRWDVILCDGAREWARSYWLRDGETLDDEAELGPSGL
jgi:hypothetical protein